MKNCSRTNLSQFLTTSTLLMLGLMVLVTCSQVALAQQPAQQPAKQPAQQPAKQPAQQPAKQPAKQPETGQKAPNYYYPTVELWSADGDNIYNNNPGYVGVGTYTPAYQLDIMSSINQIARFGTSAADHSEVLFNAPSGYNAFLTLQNGDVSQWFLGNNATNNRFSFTESTGMTEVFSILRNGKVGVGTATPGFKFDVQGGQINASGGLCIANICKLAWSEVGGSQWTSAIGATIHYNMGNVGVGTSSPTAQLHVAGADGVLNNTAAAAPDALRVVGGTGGNGTWGASPGGVGGGMSFAGGTGGLAVAGSPAALGGKGGSIDLVGGNGGPNLFSYGGGAGGDVSINGGAGVANSHGNIFLANLRGNVGVGTAAPGYRLDVQGGQINSSGGLCIAGICKSAWSEVGGSQWTTTGSNVSYSGGNVGIGTAAPFAKFVVHGAADTSLAIGDRTTSGSVGLQFMGTGYRHGALRFDGDNLIFESASSSSIPSTWYDANPMNFIVRNGNVGVGTTSPGAPLEIRRDQNGPTSLYINNATAGSGTGAATGIGFYENGTLKAHIFSANSGSSGYNGGARALQFWNFHNSPILFATNGVERVRFDGSGNVGIGTSSPAYALDVNGSLRVASGNLFHLSKTGTNRDMALVNASVSDNLGLMTAYPSAGTNVLSIFAIAPRGAGAFGAKSQLSVYNTDFLADGVNLERLQVAAMGTKFAIYSDTFGTGVNRPIDIHANGTSGQLYLNTTGSVGIGTTSPSASYKLDVNGGINASGGLCIAGICKSNWSEVGASQWATNGANVSFSTGNVGLGTTNPSSRFEVVDANPGTAASVRVLSGSSSAFTGYAVGRTAAEGYWGVAAVPNNYANGSVAGDVVLRGESNLVLANGNAISLFLKANGNVGIGTTAPGSKLFVGSGTPAVTTLAGLNVALGGNTYVSASNGIVNTFIGADTYNYGIVGTLSNHPLGLRANNVLAVTVLPSGSVGIGTPSPNAAYKLDVNGSVNVSGNINVDGNINAKYQDVAEWVPATHALAPGTVVTLNLTKSNHVEASSKAYDTTVAGVISERPGIALGERAENKVLVATTGRVRIKVDATKGPIRIGDLLVTSDREGFAMKSEEIDLGGVRIHRPGTLIGKALEPLAKGTGEILVLLSLQ